MFHDSLTNKISYYHLAGFLIVLPYDFFYSQVILISFGIHTLIHSKKENWKNITHLCWPQGNYDAAYQRVARAAGFTHLYTTEHGVVRREVDPGRIPRLVIKDKPAKWFGGPMGLYGRPLLSALYLGLKSGGKGS